MSAKIDNATLVTTLSQHLKGKTREAVNFEFHADMIKVQSSSDFILDTQIQGTYGPDMIGTSFSILINNVIQLLSVGEGETTITRHGEEIVMFEQDNITVPFNIAYDERIDIEWKSVDLPGKVTSRDFLEITKGFRNLVNISKSLEVGVPPILISSGKVYCIYSNTIYMGTVPIIFPDLEIPYNTFNNLTKSITGTEVNLLVDSVKKLLLIQVNAGNAATTTYKKPNLEHIKAVENKLTEMESIGSIDITILSELELLFKCFPKDTVTLSIYKDNTVGVSFSVSNGRNIRAGNKDLDTLANIVISTTQFDTIYKTFKGTSSVEVSKGRDVICLKGLGNKQLMISGMTF